MDQITFDKELSKILIYISETEHKIRMREVFKDHNDPDKNEVIYERNIISMKDIYNLYKKMDNLTEIEKNILISIYNILRSKLEWLTELFAPGYFTRIKYSDIRALKFSKNIKFGVNASNTSWDERDEYGTASESITPIYTEEDGFNAIFMERYIRHNWSETSKYIKE